MVLGVFLRRAGCGEGGAAFRAGSRVAERPVPEIEWTDGRGSPRPRRSLACGRGSVPGSAQTRRLVEAQPSLPSLPTPALPPSCAAATCAPGRVLDLEALREAGPGAGSRVLASEVAPDCKGYVRGQLQNSGARPELSEGVGEATKGQPHRSPRRHGAPPHTQGPHRFGQTLFHTLRVSRLIKAALAAVPSLSLWSKCSEKTRVPTSKEDRIQDSLSRSRAPSARGSSPPGFLRMRSCAAPPRPPSVLRTGMFFQAPLCGRALPDLAAVRMRAPLRLSPGAQSSLRPPSAEA